MKKIILFALLLTVSSIAFGQKVEINENGLFINSKNINYLTSTEDLEKILGKPDRKIIKLYTIWTYDSLGMLIYIRTRTSMLHSISINFKKKKFDFFPLKIFSGEFTVYGIKINENTPIDSVKKLKGLIFYPGQFHVYKAKTSYLTLILEYFESLNNLEGIGISFD